MGGGTIIILAKNWTLFVWRLSVFWCSHSRQNQTKKGRRARIKKMEGMNGPDPLFVCTVQPEKAEPN
jgi:hypothetical protein